MNASAAEPKRFNWQKFVAVVEQRGQTHKTAECEQCDWKKEDPTPEAVRVAARRHVESTGHSVYVATHWGTRVRPQRE